MRAAQSKLKRAQSPVLIIETHVTEMKAWSYLIALNRRFYSQLAISHTFVFQASQSIGCTC
ncbi:hypothetical protein F3R80_02840 [Vibrio parahaemolyticus]|nr:hypothetical protein [Vibrio parahaemolyticus]EGQ8196399.1 hypothetical protein [Vibrio parahaemolyticus]EGQ9071869.1 hypothetical protein [Vibrio parahaemolyticus]EGQ9133182.1 hypothetical protein [Vibrio parahaemolyticus]EGQ9595469.1 hypothetical protein [Vibrio parahaemolyticus]